MPTKKLTPKMREVEAAVCAKDEKLRDWLLARLREGLSLEDIAEVISDAGVGVTRMTISTWLPRLDIRIGRSVRNGAEGRKGRVDVVGER